MKDDYHSSIAQSVTSTVTLRKASVPAWADLLLSDFYSQEILKRERWKRRSLHCIKKSIS